MGYSLQDFALINSWVLKMKEDYKIESTSNAFYFFLLDLILGLQEDEIKDSITDSYFLRSVGRESGHDRGIDAVYIDNSNNDPTIHLFNCKYTEDSEKAKNNNFPSTEIDKIVSFINDLLSQDTNLRNEVNTTLYGKVREIWSIFKTQNPKFVFHICSNFYNCFENMEKERFERSLNKHSNFIIKYHFLTELVGIIGEDNKKIVNGKIRGNKKEMFEKSDGDIRALILNINSRDLIRTVLDNDNIRNQVDVEVFDDLCKYPILEDAFNDNVRVYLKQRPRINRNIKETALSPENNKFFYYNNGITITCSKFEYPKTQIYPIIELENIQIVNGSQTIHSLYEAMKENIQIMEEVDVLCRIYELRNPDYSSNIAEYTNSQNPVKGRDIRSIDFVQQKLEKEFLAKGLYYERKKNQYNRISKDLRLDSEKVGQVLMAFYNKMPAEAKNEKYLIFGDKYEEVFNEDITADKVILAYKIYEYIERKKEIKKIQIEKDEETYVAGVYITFATYHILYCIKELIELKSIELKVGNLEQILELYDVAIDIIEKTIRDGKSMKKEKYSHSSFFKSSNTKNILLKYLPNRL